MSNASTSMDRTLYKFSVTSECFEAVLDIFAHFFICPLFTESATDREMHAVDAENAKNLTNDDRRYLQVRRVGGGDAKELLSSESALRA
jgi:insulysin